MKDFLKNIKLNEGNISLGLGVAVMLLAGVMLFNYFKNANTTGDRVEEISSTFTEVPAEVTPTIQVSENKGENKNQNVSEEDKQTIATKEVAATITPIETIKKPVQVVVKAESEKEYVVQKGDSLWKISENAYGTGFEWKRIYEANKSVLGENPRVLTVGTKLTLPKSEVIAQAQTEVQKVQVSEHTVNKGDNLWTIVSNACGTGFGYQTVAAENKIQNPRLIYPGQVIKITCTSRR